MGWRIVKITNELEVIWEGTWNNKENRQLMWFKYMGKLEKDSVFAWVKFGFCSTLHWFLLPRRAVQEFPPPQRKKIEKKNRKIEESWVSSCVIQLLTHSNYSSLLVLWDLFYFFNQGEEKKFLYILYQI